MFMQCKHCQRGQILRIYFLFFFFFFQEVKISLILILMSLAYFTASSWSYRLVIRTRTHTHTRTHTNTYFTNCFISSLQQHRPDVEGGSLEGLDCWKPSVSHTTYDLIRSYLTLCEEKERKKITITTKRPLNKRLCHCVWTVNGI